VPLRLSDEGTVFSAKSPIWKKAKYGDIENYAQALCSEQAYLKVNNRKFDSEYVISYNKYSGMKSVLIGMLREGKGEYFLCQMNLTGSAEHQYTAVLAQTMLRDLLNFVQNQYESEQKTFLQQIFSLETPGR